MAEPDPGRARSRVVEAERRRSEDVQPSIASVSGRAKISNADVLVSSMKEPDVGASKVIEPAGHVA